MRYVVENPDFADSYQVWDTLTAGRNITDWCTEAEANIIAFALNAVAEGDSLTRCRVVVSGIRYNGPTDLY